MLRTPEQLIERLKVIDTETAILMALKGDNPTLEELEELEGKLLGYKQELAQLSEEAIVGALVESLKGHLGGKATIVVTKVQK